MRASVLAVFPEFSARFEGRVTFLYLDVEGLVTCGVGNLVDPISACLPLPWQIDGRPATQQEIGDQWTRVKGAIQLEKRGGGAFVSVTTMRLTDDAIDDLVRTRAAQMNAVLVQRFPAFEDFPADAQLALMSLAWACGPDFRFPKLAEAVLAEDWATCAIECQMEATGNAGLVPRNAAQKALFLAAQPAVDQNAEDEVTGWSV
jgi:GH24 family phage-related lysozyme (muramidase)